MLLSVSVALLVLQSVAALPSSWASPAGDIKSHRARSPGLARSTALEVSEYIITLGKALGTSPSSRALWTKRNAAMGIGAVIPVGEGSYYDAQVELGNQCFHLIFDTGSAELWVPKTTFQCYQISSDGDHVSVPQSACGFSNLYEGTFDEGAIANENLNISYGTGGFVIGEVGFEDVSVAGLTVEGQEINLVTEAHWIGAANITSGVIGFAYPHLTSTYSGDNPATDSNATIIHHNPFIFNAIAQKKIAPVFSLALERGPNGGIGHVALGGLPDVNFIPDFASAPIEARAITAESQNTSAFTYYTITPQGYTLGCSHESTDFPVIVDSGSTFIYYPEHIAKQFNDLFDPPAEYIPSEGVYQVDCDAVPPSFGVKIGGQTFHVNPKDLLLKEGFGVYPTAGKCLTGVQPANSGAFFLGELFLKNVVAVFDIGASELLFAAHYY